MANEVQSAYVARALSRLALVGFVCEEGVTSGTRVFNAVARRTRFELTKSGFCETFVVFSVAASGTLDEITALSHDAFQHAVRSKAIPLPRGLFETVVCFSAALTESVDPATAETLASRTPTRHWAAFEIPLAYDAASIRIHFFSGTPVWGAAYYREFRSLIEAFLSP